LGQLVQFVSLKFYEQPKEDCQHAFPKL